MRVMPSPPLGKKVHPGRRGARILSALSLAVLVTVSCQGARDKPEEPRDAANRKPVELTAEVNRAEAGVSDPIEFRVTLEADPGIEVSLPEAGPLIEGFRKLDMGREGPVLKEGRNWSQEWTKLQADLAGSYVLPGLRVSWRDAAGQEQSAETPQIFVEIKSSLKPEAEGGEKDIRDLKPLEKIKRPVPWRWIAAGAGTLVVLACVAGILFARRRRRARQAVARPPEEMARRELDDLEATGILEEERYREYVFNLSLILRRYLERRFSIPAVEQTTEEILAALRGSSALEEETKKKIRSFLQESDPIKYRGLAPAGAETGGLREQLLALLHAAAAPIPVQEVSWEEDQVAAGGGT